MLLQKITSLDLYTKFPSGKVLQTKCLEDVTCGIHPCYYTKCEDVLKVSTSVVSLIFDLGVFDLNPRFKPTQFAINPLQQNLFKLNRRLIDLINKLSKKIFFLGNAWKSLKSKAPLSLKRLTWYPETPCYESWETIDKKIKKLRSFERVNLEGNIINFKPDFAIQDLEYIVDKTAYYLQKSIQGIEREFPEKVHIVLTGGKDSQLISLVPKLNKEKWYIFSGEPNFPLVEKWVRENDIPVSKMFRHDGRREESKEDFKRKIICGDLYSSPCNIMYLPTLKKIAKKFNYQCIFWLGTMTRGAHFFEGRGYKFGENDLEKKRADFFNIHLHKFPCWQGNILQVYTNFVGCPFLSPYYFKEIWEELFQHFDPFIISKDTDLRSKIGEKLFGKSIKWIKENPTPPVYNYYCFWFNRYKYYKQYIKDGLIKAAKFSR